jgi:hypothetical protein
VPRAELAETPKPKKKRTRWWEDIPDPTDPTNTTDKASIPKLPPARQKWLSLRGQALALAAEKKREDAVRILRVALDLACKESGQDDAACVETMQILAMVLARMGNLEEAEKLLREAVQLNEKYGNADDEFDDSRQALVAVLLKQGKTEEAKEFWKPTDPPLPPPKASATAAPAALPVATTNVLPPPPPPEDTRDPWTQIIDEIREEKAAKKKDTSPSSYAKP